MPGPGENENEKKEQEAAEQNASVNNAAEQNAPAENAPEAEVPEAEVPETEAAEEKAAEEKIAEAEADAGDIFEEKAPETEEKKAEAAAPAQPNIPQKKEADKKKKQADSETLDEELYRPEPMPEKPTPPSNAFVMMLKRIARILNPSAFPEAKKYADEMKRYDEQMDARDRREERRLKLIEEREAAWRQSQKESKDLNADVKEPEKDSEPVKKEDEKAPEKEPEKEVDTLIEKLEKDKGPLSEQVKNNIRELSENAEKATQELTEKSKNDPMFVAGDAARNMIAFNQLKQAINNGSVSDLDMEILSQPQCSQIMRERTKLSKDANFFAEHSHTAESVSKNLLSKDGLDEISTKFGNKLTELSNNKDTDYSKTAENAKLEAEKEWKKEHDTKNAVKNNEPVQEEQKEPVQEEQKKPVQEEQKEPVQQEEKTEELSADSQKKQELPKDAESTIEMMEQKYGKLSDTVKDNIRSLQAKADEANINISEQCKKGAAFAGGDDVKYLIANSKLQKDIANGTLSPKDIAALNSENGLKTLYHQTEISTGVNQLANYKMPAAAFARYMLNPDGRDGLVSRVSEKLKNAETKGLDVEKQIDRAKNRAAETYQQQTKAAEQKKEELGAVSATAPKKQKQAEGKGPEDAKNTITRMERMYGPLPKKIKDNIYSIQTRANDAYKNIRENCKKGEPFAGGDDVKYIALNSKLQKDINSGMMPAKELLSLNSNEGVSNLLKQTELSLEVNLLADHNMSPSYFEKYLLEEKGQELITNKLSSKLQKIETKGLDLSKQVSLSKDKAEAKYQEKPEKWLGIVSLKEKQPEVKQPEVNKEEEQVAMFFA